MTPIKTLPELDWTDQAKAEIASQPADFVANSDFAWQIDDLFIAGWYYPALSSPPWFWFAMTNKFAGMKLRRLYEYQFRIPSGAETSVEAGWEVGDKFAKTFGFVPTGEIFTQNGVQYLKYRRA